MSGSVVSPFTPRTGQSGGCSTAGGAGLAHHAIPETHYLFTEEQLAGESPSPQAPAPGT